MADEWWTTSAHSGGGDVSSATESAAASSRQISISSISFQLPASGFVVPDDGAAASSSYSSFLDDPEMAGSTSFDGLLRLQGDASHRFLLVGRGGAAPDPVVPQPAALYDADGVVASSQQGGGGVPLYADSQYGSSLSGSYGEVVRAAASTTAKPKLFSQSSQPLQQFPGFFSSPALFGTAPVSPPQLLLQALEQKSLKSNTEPAQDACSSSVPIRSGAAPDSPAAMKKPRIQTPSPLPTFKVRKEKLGDRITALQQLVSPFGKTDTASVLHEAIECIKFLHDQVASLSSPYLSCGRPVKQPQHQQWSDGGGEEDLRSRGLCLVPVASTYTVVSETAAAEFWHPTFGGTSR